MTPRVVAGVDEAGRGPLAGPVVAAAVILNAEQRRALMACGLRDSKKLSPAKREKIFSAMNELGVVWRAQAASWRRIDETNILAAALWAMARCVEKLPVAPELVLIDGNTTIKNFPYAQKAVVKGDDKVPAIAAASVVAKVLRDRAMVCFARLFPEYGFAGHKGYPSKAHREIIAAIGLSPIHRRTFRGCR